MLEETPPLLLAATLLLAVLAALVRGQAAECNCGGPQVQENDYNDVNEKIIGGRNTAEFTYPFNVRFREEWELRSPMVRC